MADEAVGWRQLEDLLGGRPHWRFESGAGVARWCFGQEGAWRLVIGFDVDHFTIYSVNTDDEYPLSSIEGVSRWLESHESEHEGWTELQRELGGHLLAEEAEKWLGEPPDPSPDE